jgi:hypothetical protein
MRLVHLLVSRRMRRPQQGTTTTTARASQPAKPPPQGDGRTAVLVVASWWAGWSEAHCSSLQQILVQAKAAQLKSWQCETCRSKGAVPAPSPLVEDDPRQWTLAEGTIISCLPEVTTHAYTTRHAHHTHTTRTPHAHHTHTARTHAMCLWLSHASRRHRHQLCVCSQRAGIGFG